MRILSFLPSATEMVYALGLGDQLVGVTHECDYPPEARTRPVVVRSAIALRGLTPAQIDAAVRRRLQAGESLYVADEALIRTLAPDLILTQDLCQVCAPSGDEVGRVVRQLARPPQILWMTPRRLDEIFDNVRELGGATGRAVEAADLIDRLRARIRRVEQVVAGAARPRVFCMEWLAPPYNAGHWMPDLVERAGGLDGIGAAGRDSVRIEWRQIRAYAPESLIVAPCGFGLEDALHQAHLLARYPGWDDLPAVRADRVYVVDANSYFARPGPRVVDGIELLAHLFHPDRCGWSGPSTAFRRLSAAELAR
jgi:iron complex transport system substrate-binding protein